MSDSPSVRFQFVPDVSGKQRDCFEGRISENEKNIPAQEASEKESSRIYEENVYQERQKGLGSQTCKGQSKTQLLILVTIDHIPFSISEQV